jgi:hypothetical protein
VVAGLLSSPRRRRRLLRGGGTLIVVAGIVVAGVHWSNTGHSEDLPLSNEPAKIVPQPHLQRAVLTGARREAARLTVATWMENAVRGRHIASTWSLVSPSFRQGFTHAQWSHGITPIVPFHFTNYKVAVSEAYADRVELEVLAFAPRTSGLRDQTFSLELTQSGTGKGAHWQVNYFMPKASLSPRPAPGVEPAPPPSNKATLGPVWLLVPFGLIGGALLAIAGFGLRGWYRGVRANRAYRAERGL